MTDRSDECPTCGHRWRAHRGRNGGERCYYNSVGLECHCRRKNPDIEAEDRLAAGLWNAWMGRTKPDDRT